MNKTSPSQQVVLAVADAENTEPFNLPEPLSETIDPEALDQIFNSVQNDRKIQFAYLDYVVTVTAEGDVELD